MKTILKVRNFGPIGEKRTQKRRRSGDGCFKIEVSSLCVLIGPQSSGKSTVAKLLSVFFWLEKTFARGGGRSAKLTPDHFKTLCQQQDIQEYFRAGTYISYDGAICQFVYDHDKNSFTVAVNNNARSYVLPKIQYISSARNLLTLLYHIGVSRTRDRKGNVLEFSSSIPFMVRDLNDEYLKALNTFGSDGFTLPINGMKVCYEQHNVFVRTGESKTSMSAASSGVQAITPMLIVSRYHAENVKSGLAQKVQRLSPIERKWIEASIPVKFAKAFQLLNSGTDAFLSESDRKALETYLKKFIPSCFFNIVEEPEQNLFPETQAEVLYELVECLNATPGNKLVISTHSPYVLTALNNALLAREKYDETGGKTIPEFPLERTVPFAEVSAYMFENGTVSPITDNDVKLIDADKIDSCSSEISEAFDSLMELSNA